MIRERDSRVAEADTLLALDYADAAAAKMKADAVHSGGASIITLNRSSKPTILRAQ
jgi:hypothetical protein